MEKSLYVKPELVKGFRDKKDKFNYKKLINLLLELNQNYSSQNPYTCAMLIRAILDHIPPLLGFHDFTEVANNYAWGRTEKGHVKKLQEFKDLADDTLHKQISHKPDLIEMGEIPESIRLNTLLQECLIKGGQIQPPLSRINQQPKIKIELDKNEVSWANYAARHHVWSSFRIALKIDNFNSNKPDYIKVALIANSSDGSWAATHFIFEPTKEEDLRADQDYRIEANEIKTVGVLISDSEFGTSEKRLMPDFDKDTLQLVINTRSGGKFNIVIKSGWIMMG